MAIADELTKLENNRANIVAAINSKGGELAENAGLAACPEAIEQLGNSGGTTIWTGHVDEAGLRYIGWDDEDIAKLKRHVDWNSSDDELFKVPQSHKDMYDRCSKIAVNGRTMLPYSEIERWTKADFKLRYLPMIDFSEETRIDGVFSQQYSLIAIPNINVEKVISITNAFSNCSNILYIPNFNKIEGNLYHCISNCNKITEINIREIYSSYLREAFSSKALKWINATFIKPDNSIPNLSGMFAGMNSMEYIPWIDTSGATTMQSMFASCYMLRTIPQIDTSAATDANSMFNVCLSLYTIPKLNFSSVTNCDNMFYGCTNLTELPELDFSNTTSVYNMYRDVKCLRTPLVVNFPKAKSYSNVCRNINCKSIEWHIHSGITQMDNCFNSGICEQMAFSGDSVLTSITQSSYLPFNNSSNSINKGCVNYALIKEVCEMMLRGVPAYSAASYPMYFESGSTVTDDAAGTLQSLVEQCQAMGWAIYNLTINPYTE